MPSYDRRDPEKAYEQITVDIRKAMRGIEEKLRTHSGKARDNNKDWGYVGDAAEVLKRLGEISDFLTVDRHKDGA
jgi:hypothetical protein